METGDLFNGDFLRKMRTRLQMSVARLAGVSGLVEAQVRFLEEGGDGCSIRLETMVQILQALKFLLPYLHAPILRPLFLSKSGYGKVVRYCWEERKRAMYDEMYARIDLAMKEYAGTRQEAEKEA